MLNKQKNNINSKEMENVQKLLINNKNKNKEMHLQILAFSVILKKMQKLFRLVVVSLL